MPNISSIVKNVRNIMRQDRGVSGDAQRLEQLIGWMNPELEQLARMLDRFKQVHQDGLTPWLNKLRNNWPAK